MANTPNLALPLLDAAQAQKHVTMNEATARLDSFVFGAVTSVGAVTPPEPSDGEAHIVGDGAGGLWSGHDNELALAMNGGWEFFAPRPGWRVWSLPDHTEFFCDGSGWQPNVAVCSPGSAITAQEIQTFDHALSGSSSLTAELIPDKAVVIGVSARVVEAITGASSWSIGVPGSTDRYGSGFGPALNSYAEGLTGQPQTYYGGTPIEITAGGGGFTGGTLRIAIHCMRISAPKPV